MGGVFSSDETQETVAPPSLPAERSPRQRIGTMDKKWKDQIKKDKTIYKHLSEFVEKRRKMYDDLDDLLEKKVRVCSLSTATLKEKKISVVTEPDSPHTKHEFVRKAFIKHDEVEQAIEVALETSCRVHGSQEGVTKEILEFVQKKFDLIKTNKQIEAVEERASQQEYQHTPGITVCIIGTKFGADITPAADIGSFPHRNYYLEDFILKQALLTLLAILWLLLFLKECCCDLLRSLSYALLSSQALEYILVASGDVEQNPGPTYFTDEELTEICNNRLVEDDVPAILKAVSSISGRYSSFLRILGLPESQLSEIRAECHDNPQECLQRGITCLLQDNFNSDKHGPLTWRRLVEAVADTAGGSNHKLARKIAAEHKGLPNSSVDNGERENLKLQYKQSGLFAVMFPKLKRSLERSLKPDDLKEFLRYFCNPASPDHCLVDKQLYGDLDSTSDILDSLHPKYINPANLLLLQEIVDNFGSEQSKTLLQNYNRQWEWQFYYILMLLGALFFVYYLLNFNLFSFICT